MCKSRWGGDTINHCGDLWTTETIIVHLCGRNHWYRGGVSIPEGGHHHERLQPSQCTLFAGNLPAQRGLASRRVALHEAWRSAQLHQRWNSRTWWQHLHRLSAQLQYQTVVSDRVMAIKNIIKMIKWWHCLVVKCFVVFIVIIFKWSDCFHSHRTPQWRTWWVSGCRWLKEWNILPARSLYTETSRQETACELFNKLPNRVWSIVQYVQGTWCALGCLEVLNINWNFNYTVKPYVFVIV